MPEIFTELAKWKLTRGYLSALIRGEGGDFMGPGSENAMTTGQGLTRAFRGPLLLPTLAGSRVFFNTDTSFAGLGSAVIPGAIISSVLADGGSNYAVGDTGTVNGGDGIAAYEVLTVSGAGVVLTYSLTSPGTNYAVSDNVETTSDGAQPGVGLGFKIDILVVSGGGAGSVFKVQDLLCYIGSGQVAFAGAYLAGIIASATLSVVKKIGGVYAAGPLSGPFQAGNAQPPAAVIYAKAPPSAGQKLMNGAVSVVIWRISSITGQISLMSEPSNVITLTNGSVIVQMPLLDANAQDMWGIGVVKIGFADLGWYYELPTSLNGEVRETDLTVIDGNPRSVEISWTNGSLLGQDLAPDKAFPPAPGQFANVSNDVAWLDADGIIYVGEPGFIGSFAPGNALFASEPAVTYLKVNDGLTIRLGKTTIGTLYYVGGSPALEYQVIVENQGIEFAQNACIGANGRLLAWIGKPTVIDSNAEPDFEYSRDVTPDFEGWDSQTADAPIVPGYDPLGKYECWFKYEAALGRTKCMAKFVPDNSWCAPIYLTVGDDVIGGVIAAVTVRNRLYLCCSDGSQLAMYQFDAGSGSVMKIHTSDVTLMNYFSNVTLIMFEGRADNTDNPVHIEVVKNYDDANPIPDTLSEYEATPRGVGTQVFCPRQPDIKDVNSHKLVVTMTSIGGDCGPNILRTLGPKWEVLLHQCPAGTLPQVITFPPIEDRCADLSAPDFLVSALSDSGLTVTFTITGPATLIDNGNGTALVHLTGEPGLVTVTARQVGDGTHDPAPDVIQTFTAMDCIGPPAQLITFPPIPDKCAIPADPDFLISAIASSGLTVVFEVTSGPATLIDYGNGTALVHLTGIVGLVTITARQDGNGVYDPAPDVVRTFNATDCGPVDCAPALGPLLWVKPETLGAPLSVMSGWEDSSGNNFDLVATLGLEPTVSADAIPGAVFDGTKQLLGATSALLNAGEGYTLFMVMKENVSTRHEIVGKFGVTPPEDFSGWLLGRNPVTEFGIFGDMDNWEYFNSYYENPDDFFFYSDITGNVHPGLFDTNLHVYAVRMYPETVMQGVRWEAWRDGTLIDTHWKQGTNETGYQCLPSPTETGPFWMGLASPSPWWAPDSGFDGTMFELLLYAPDLSSAGFLATNNYLRNKFAKASPKRTYSLPVEIGRVQYNDQWDNLAPHALTEPGDLIVILTRVWIESGSGHDSNAVGDSLYAQTRNTGLSFGIDNTASPGDIVRVEWWSRVAQGNAGNISDASLNSGGNGYAVGNQGTVDTGDGLATYQVASVDGMGTVLAYYLTSQGSGYAVSANVATTATTGVGTGFTIDITSVAADTLTIKSVTTAPETTPNNPFMISLVTYRNLEASAGVRKAYEGGRGIPAYGEVQQDSVYNFSFTPEPLMSPPQAVHRSDGNYSANDNEMQYLCFVKDTGDPEIQSNVLAQGSTGAIEGGDGDSWAILSMLFYAESVEAVPEPPPLCE